MCVFERCIFAVSSGNWMKGCLHPYEARPWHRTIHWPCYCLRAVTLWHCHCDTVTLSQGWRAMCTKYGWIASWCCVCYFCTQSYVLQFYARPSQCCSASYRDCNNPRLIYLDKKSMALPHFARTTSSGVSIVAAVSLLTFHKSQVCREKELCFLHCNAFWSALEQRSMGHMNYFQGWAP